MTDEQIEALAETHEMDHNCYGPSLLAYTRAVIEAERERCAKIADAEAAYKPWNDHATCEVCEEIAAAIRKGETP